MGLIHRLTATPSPRLGAGMRRARFVAAGTALVLGVAGVPAAVATAAAAPLKPASATAPAPVAPPLTPEQLRAGQVASQVAGVADWFLKIDDAVATQKVGYSGAKLAQSGAVAMAKAVNKAVAADARSRTVSVGSPSRPGGAATTTGARTATSATAPGRCRRAAEDDGHDRHEDSQAPEVGQRIRNTEAVADHHGKHRVADALRAVGGRQLGHLHERHSAHGHSDPDVDEHRDAHAGSHHDPLRHDQLDLQPPRRRRRPRPPRPRRLHC